MWRRSVAVLVLIALGGSAALHAQGKPSSAAAGSPAANLFNQECAGCHAEDGHGFENMPGIPDFRDPDFRKSRTDQEFADSIMNGNRLMPTFRLVLNSDQVHDLVAYVRKLPELPAETRQERTSCATCHGNLAPGSFIKRKK